MKNMENIMHGGNDIHSVKLELHKITRSVLKVKKIHKDASLPIRKLKSAGYDLASCMDYVVKAHDQLCVRTGLKMAILDNHYGRIAPRSGLTVNHKIYVGAGVIDAGYRGEICVVLFNHSNYDLEIKTGDLIAQLILEKISTPEILEVDEL